MHKVLIIEDDSRIAQLVKRGLEDRGYSVDLAYDGNMGRKLGLRGSYGLIIIDVILPGMNGIEVCQEIKKSNSSIPIIMLTALGTADDKVEGFDAGADDYLVKPFDFRELEVRIRNLIKLFSNKEFTSNSVIEYEGVVLDANLKSITREGKSLSLTPKEYNLLEYMLRNRERVLSRKEIAENVWDTHFDTGTNFIDVYINYLRKKVDKEFHSKLIHTRPGMGFILKKE
ncbi:response regulator transcription factor [Marinilabiliaceae bacterium ANBcel2]|nr:response regulator transcription factor [Marinilabiliaceae bacterium ANBcel2]